MLLNEMSDDDLIFLVDAKSQLAEQELINRYMVIAKNVAKEYADVFSDSGILYDDFYSIAISCIHIAIHSYNNRKVPFKKYWKICVRNAIYDYVKDNSYRSGAKALSEISLDDTCYKESDSVRFHETVADSHSTNTIYDILYDYASSDSDYFTKDEKVMIILHYLEERTIDEFCDITGWSKSKANYVIKNAKKKIFEILKDNYF